MRSTKWRLKDKKTTDFILLLFTSGYILLVLFLAFFPLGVASSFGLRPMTHWCLGLIVKSKNVINLLPEGDITFFSTGTREFRYFVPHQLLDNRVLCLGIDIWYGE